jgi:hypothetical protein
MYESYPACEPLKSATDAVKRGLYIRIPSDGQGKPFRHRAAKKENTYIVVGDMVHGGDLDIPSVQGGRCSA